MPAFPKYTHITRTSLHAFNFIPLHQVLSRIQCSFIAQSVDCLTFALRWHYNCTKVTSSMSRSVRGKFLHFKCKTYVNLFRLQSLNIKPAAYACGRTKIFIRNPRTVRNQQRSAVQMMVSEVSHHNRLLMALTQYL